MIYTLYNGPQQTSASPSKVASGTSIKTMQQWKPILPCKVNEWGVSGDASAAATPGELELIESGTVAATVTAYVSGDVGQQDAEALNAGDPGALYLTFSTSTSGYTSSAEGSVSATRNLVGPQQMGPTNQFLQQFPLGFQPYCQIGKIYRIRVNFGTSVNLYTYAFLAF